MTHKKFTSHLERKAFTEEEIKQMFKEELVVFDPVWKEIGALVESLHNRVSALEEAVNTIIRKMKDDERV